MSDDSRRYPSPDDRPLGERGDHSRASLDASETARSRTAAGVPTHLDVFRQRGLKELLAEYERSLILTALEASRGHQRRAAAALGVLPSTLCEKMRRLGIRQGGAEAAPDAS